MYTDGDYDKAIQAYTEAINSLVQPKKIVEIIEEEDGVEGSGGDSILCNEEVATYLSNRCACYLQIKDYDRVIEDATEAIDLKPTPTIHIKILSRRAQAYESTEKLNDALNDYKQVLEMDKSHQQALSAMRRLPPLIKIKEEKEREEMMGKLKDLGNSLLGKFGLSTDNFQFIKDPTSGGYSVNFKK
ncbi:hypothetical protein DFA_03067 [Cavenderia fasciculata]|uniref:Tetratricopeptide-like helical domain-containing protein n=1 Tax=Cavenderia fasciculata TaxID=261658 RepID=F4PGI8_CACFS|nr:uncharacterized protein DFA_03067 [Cavenderia fasciculata]EGG24822.1 hypothetical protein DFA_03067 [Cavenderia fasciculata]|eukprot:XP_004362673.1 hypothetical protein DFA_03067 [Cavenderia fasciculata]